MTILLALVFIHPFAWSDSDYKFLDYRGNQILLPEDLPVYTKENPGPWATRAQDLEPEITTWVRKDGLESIRILLIKAKNIFQKEDSQDGYIEAIYVLDKDELIVGYAFYGEEHVGVTANKISINGIINEITVYIEYKNLGLWKIPLKISLSESA